jgi:ribonuclease P protein component
LRRLRGAGAFEAVFAAGRRIDGRYLQIVAAPAAQSPGRIGYVIGRKSIPRAVDRNRLRRRLRELVRTERPALDAYDIILRVRNVVPASEVPSAAAEAAQLLQRLLASRR